MTGHDRTDIPASKPTETLTIKSASKRLFWFISTVMLTGALGLSACQKSADDTSDTVNSSTADNTSTQAPTVNSINDSTATPTEIRNEKVTVLALGDSLTEGLGVDADKNYPAQLEARLKDMGYPNVTVINSGLSGETSTGMVNRLDWVSQTKPDITLLIIGANDAMRGIDVPIIEDNIRTAIKTLRENNSKVILGGMQIYDNLGSGYVADFAAIYPRVAKDMDVPLIPFFLKGVAANPQLNQSDAIHPTAEGYRIVVNDNILPALLPILNDTMDEKASDTPSEGSSQ
ncbi:arylesterase [Psychrobacter aestuarii]|uniref:SGNH hydrolase-type esterase domain-containing protein n=1 Tax=Psychrobacter aestuarii TaxID=556327 RepID=A0ABP3FSE3_9GAMM|nr:arylesterase [Psychrobacter aestuarii]